ncbi:hypothetical protein PH7735_03268 [Shimia thalassica]|uniref:Glycosyl transferase family 2 n=1 Tax=Shimia thalassica TaxID=1715693 RepID=A0A0P1IEH9_9RHOB|nr:glycosyltransferase family 2 protein [Shimia thalassica]CUK08607.1 hypothetical protein PH7735_03268 [Shimia thalassica]
MKSLKAFDIIENSRGFDPEWYNETYLDAEIVGLSPEEHYKAFGHFLGRGVNPELTQLNRDKELMTALSRQPIISYCTPLMNRPDDVRGTLRANLDENRVHEDKLEFVLVFLDEDTETHNWVRENFASDLESGYLRMVIESSMDGWHFGKAKNRHKHYAVGTCFSSLDGDNFVTREETDQLLEVVESFGEDFVFHHFSGNWGDGSSGRVSMPMSIYQKIGYDELFMPRQYDEMDLLLSVLCNYPNASLLRIKTDNHGFNSQRSLAFFEKAKLNNPVVELEMARHVDPLNPKGDTYVQEDLSLNAMTGFNQASCFLKNARNSQMRNEYLNEVVKARHIIIDTVPKEKILGTIFKSTGYAKPEDLNISDTDVCIFTCMKNDDMFLPQFYEHYKSLGIAHFFIVDDGSDIPIGETLPHPDVHVFTPKVGNFLTSKGMWMEALMKGYLNEGQWTLAVDADEFMDLPKRFDTFSDLAQELLDTGTDTMPALLIDLVPRPDVSTEELDKAETDFQKVLDHHIFCEEPVGTEYLKSGPIKWGFGPFTRLSWLLDTRYHGFGTMDSLRKIPLTQFRAHRHINQGFHTLHYTDDTPNPGSEIWDTDMVLPIRHYKLLKLFSNAARKRMADQVASATGSQYHARTTANIAKIFEGGGEEQLKKLLSLPSKAYADEFLTQLDPRVFKD